MKPPQLPRGDQLVAVFGGAFDPPHRGHLEAAQGLLHYPGVKNIIVLPSATPPHKATATSTAHRLAMTELCFGNIPEIEINRCELTRAERSKTPSYSFDTILELKHNIPHLAFVIGTDQLEALPSWHRFPELLGLCHWLVLARKPHGLQTAQALMQPLVSSRLARPVDAAFTWALNNESFLMAVETPAREVSSSQIREMIGRTGQPPLELLTKEVAAYLNQNRLYGSTQMQTERSLK